MGAERARYAAAVFVLAGIGAACAVVIVLGEILGGPQRPWFWQAGGAALGLIFVVYGLILLLLRKMGLVGPRRAER
ncbi:MAG: hypothetical protein QN168_07285 [Armatimonadota bacterium]|nr:hypothetical protein [Armatimonadota bacterium]